MKDKINEFLKDNHYKWSVSEDIQNIAYDRFGDLDTNLNDVLTFLLDYDWIEKTN